MQKKENILSKNNGAYNLLWQDREKERRVGAEAGKPGQDQPSVPSVPHKGVWILFYWQWVNLGVFRRKIT